MVRISKQSVSQTSAQSATTANVVPPVVPAVASSVDVVAPPPPPKKTSKKSKNAEKQEKDVSLPPKESVSLEVSSVVPATTDVETKENDVVSEVVVEDAAVVEINSIVLLSEFPATVFSST